MPQKPQHKQGDKAEENSENEHKFSNEDLESFEILTKKLLSVNKDELSQAEKDWKANSK